MPESKLRVIFVALIIRRISYALSAWGGFLNIQQINRINALFLKARRSGLCSSTCLCDVSEYLRIVDGRLFNRIQSPPTAYHIGFHHKSTILVYVLQDIVIHFLYPQVTSINVFLFPDVCSVFSDLQSFLLYQPYRHVHLSFVVLIKR